MKSVMVKEREYDRLGMKVMVLRPQRTDDEAAQANIVIAKKLARIMLA